MSGLVRSNRSMKNDDTENIPQGFETVLYDTCAKYNCTYTVFVTRDIQRDECLKKLKTPESPVKYKRIAMNLASRAISTVRMNEVKSVPVSATTIATTTATTATVDPNALHITAVYDNSLKLVEIKLNKIRPVPRTLMLIINLILLPHDRLAKITFNRCFVDAFVIYELNKTISISAITDLIFDRTILAGDNLKDLLENSNAAIKNLSLCGCEINDETCKVISSGLSFSKPAEKTLMVLNLSGNRITDEGARYLGEALRSNRHLRYLNLADNRIADDGAEAIFNSLKEFICTHDEVMNKRKCLLEYLKAKHLITMRYLSEVATLSDDEQVSQKPPNKKKMSTTSLHSKTSKKDKDKKKDNFNKPTADSISMDIMGPFLHPFAPNNIKTIEDRCYCSGNMVLSYLNLSYNHITYCSVSKLVSVLQYQKANKKLDQTGLIKIVIEGNQLPIICNEYQIINDLSRIAKNMVPQRDRRASEVSIKRSRTAIISPSTKIKTKN